MARLSKRPLKKPKTEGLRPGCIWPLSGCVPRYNHVLMDFRIHRHFLTVLVFVALAFAIGAMMGRAVAQGSGLQAFSKSTLEIEAQDGKHRFKVEIAQSPRQQAQGLMFRRRLAADAGMLFLYGQPQIIKMWMKNTFIPLDMIFIGANGRIVSIVERTIPQSLETVSSAKPANAILEVNGGTVSRLGIRAGDRVRHPALGTGG